ncbi:hypothetical protein DXG03_009137 [Asterophora parasitica]|uniref:CCHC-type domain-containing protein n=1 Tax=Asterophora parasitica TaxID=117018 RepID=A0A9P7K7U9_9AGAR|nr:hypothetical protein DXG03_009137 [Asterophora parasitica]
MTPEPSDQYSRHTPPTFRTASPSPGSMPGQPLTPLHTSYQPLPPTHTAIMVTKTMPRRNSYNALVFNGKAVRELGWYFSDLELLFTDCGITDEAEKKAYGCCYLNINDHTLWKSIDSYTTNSYDDWKAKIFELHPGSEENAQFNQTDLDLLLTTTRTTGICSLSKLGEFHRTYLNISNFLVSKGIIADLEQYKAFCSIFSPAMWTQIQSRLNIVKPNHAVGTPYTIMEILSAATFYFKQASAISTDAIATTPGPQVKSKEAIISGIQHLEQAINMFTGQIQHLKTGTGGGPPNQQLLPGPPLQNYPPPAQARGPCNFCSRDNHYISTCPEAECYIQDVPPHPRSPPIHLFSNIPNNRYVLPSTHNLATTDWHTDPAYCMEAPITNAAKSTKLFDHCLKSTLTVLVGKLCSVAPAIQKLRKAITPKWVMTAALGSIVKVLDNHYTSCIEELDALLMAEDAHSNSTPLPGALITTNVIDTYYQNLWLGKSLECVMVAKESHSLWSILMCIDAWEQVKCIVDSGCQIIAMLEEVCHNLHICYDPTVILHMQSANRMVDPSLGLAWNIPCTIGNITLYLQIHIIWNLAYNILLGRPFDVLTCSSVKTHLANETIITITNPTCVVTSIPFPGLYPVSTHAYAPLTTALGSTTPSVNPDPYPIPARSQTTSRHLSPYAPAIPSSLHESSVLHSWSPDLPLTLIATATSTSPPSSPTPPKSALGVPAICKVKGVQSKKKYKPVTQKVRSVVASCPDHFWIECKILGNLLADMPILNPNPPPFRPTS